MDFGSRKGKVLYVVAGIMLAGLMMLLDAPGGAYVAMILPYVTIGFVVFAKRED